MVGVATGEEVLSLRYSSCGEDLVFLLERCLPGRYGSYLLPLFDDPSVIRPSVTRGGTFCVETGPARVVEEGESRSSASPLYRGMPSAPISTLGGLRKCVLSKYSGEISKEASSGKEDGERRRPLSTSSML